MAMGTLHDGPSASETTLKDWGKNDQYQPQQNTIRHELPGGGTRPEN